MTQATDRRESRDRPKPYPGGPHRPKRDFSAEVHLTASRSLRWALWVVGTLSLGTGLIGVFVPGLPTTPFLLLSAACYARSSVRFYNWLMNQRLLGPYIRAWRENGTVPLRVKLFASLLIALTIGTTVVFFIPVFAVQILVTSIGIAVIIYISRLPSAPAASTPSWPRPAIRGNTDGEVT